MSINNLDDLHEDDDSATENVDNKTDNNDSSNANYSDDNVDNTGADDLSGAGGDGTDSDASGEKTDTIDTTTEEVENGIEEFLSQYGIQGGMIDFESAEEGEDSPKRAHFNDLTESEKANILISLAEKGKTSVEEQYGLDKEEISLLNLARERGSVGDLIDELAQRRIQEMQSLNTTEVDYDEVASDDIYRQFLKESDPDAADEEIEKDLQNAKTGSSYDKLVDNLRSKFKSGQEVTASKNAEKLANIRHEELEKDRRDIVRAVQGIDQVAGFEVTEEDANPVLSKVLELGSSGDSKFMEEVFGNPENIFKAAYMYYKGEELVNSLEEHYKAEVKKSYMTGKRDALEGAPSRRQNFQSSTGSNTGSDAPVRRDQRISMSDLHDED